MYNELMAKFMGWKLTGHPYNNWIDDDLRIIGTTEDLRFEKTYDWLLEICRRLSLLSIDMPEYTVHMDNIKDAIFTYDIKILYKEVGTMLEWYYKKE